MCLRRVLNPPNLRLATSCVRCFWHRNSCSLRDLAGGGGATGEARWLLRGTGFPAPGSTTWGSKEKPDIPPDVLEKKPAKARATKKKRKTEVGPTGETTERAKARVITVSFIFCIGYEVVDDNLCLLARNYCSCPGPGSIAGRS